MPTHQQLEGVQAEPASAPEGTGSKTKAHPVLASWLIGGIEALLAFALTVWIFTWPPVFRYYYPILQDPASLPQASAIVEWLASDHRERTLNLAVDGKLSSAELHHYSDVRRVFRWFPRVVFGASSLLALLLLVTRPSLQTFQSAQIKAIVWWGTFLVLAGGLACWNWKAFFALLHLLSSETGHGDCPRTRSV